MLVGADDVCLAADRHACVSRQTTMDAHATAADSSTRLVGEVTCCARWRTTTRGCGLSRDMTTVAPIEDLDDPTFDPILADEVMFGDLLDPYPALARLREQAGVQPGSFRGALGQDEIATEGYAEEYLVLSYAGVEHVLNHPEEFSNRVFLPTLGDVVRTHRERDGPTGAHRIPQDPADGVSSRQGPDVGRWDRRAGDRRVDRRVPPTPAAASSSSSLRARTRST